MVREYLFLLSEDKLLRAEIRSATMRMHPERFKRLTSIIGVGETAEDLRPFAADDFVNALFSQDDENAA